MKQIKEDAVSKQAEILCKMREYPTALAHLCVPRCIS